MRVLTTLGLLAVLTPVGIGAQAAPPDGDVLRLEPGDVVRVRVGDEPQLSGEFPVDEEGGVLLPLIGLVPVAGLPFPEVRDRIRSGYAAELVDAPVTVTALMRIAVLGEVRSPGLYHLDGTYSLAEVVASAGGMTPDADAADVVLLRREGTVRFSMEGVAAPADLRLRPGDQLVVGRRSWLGRNATAVLSVAGSVVAAVLTSLILR